MQLLLEHLARTWPIEVLYSLPTTFLYFTFSSIFFGHAFQSFWKKILWITLIECWCIDTFIIYIPGYLQAVNSILSFYVLFFIFFRHYSLADKIRIPLLTIIVSMIFDVASGIIALRFITMEEITAPIYLILRAWPALAIMGYITYRLNKGKHNTGHRLYQYIRLNKSVFYIVILLLTQFFSIAIFLTDFLSKQETISFLNFFAAFTIILSLLVIYFVINHFSRIKSEVFQMTEEMYIEQINNLFTSIKSQRHDFLNNAQVLIALLHRQDKEGLQKYLKEYIQELQDLSEIIIINEPAISALIQTKKFYAEQQNIQFSFKFKGMEKIHLGIKIINIVKILGNLIDNAFDEVIKLKEAERKVEIDCWVESRNMYINITNHSEKIISLNQVAQMFQANYTSKFNGHAGLGLSIIKQKVEELNGEITVSPLEKTITFEVRLPLKNNELKNTSSG